MSVRKFKKMVLLKTLLGTFARFFVWFCHRSQFLILNLSLKGMFIAMENTAMKRPNDGVNRVELSYLYDLMRWPYSSWFPSTLLLRTAQVRCCPCFLDLPRLRRRPSREITPRLKVGGETGGYHGNSRGKMAVSHSANVPPRVWCKNSGAGLLKKNLFRCNAACA